MIRCFPLQIRRSSTSSTSKNDSRAVSPEPRKFTYHSDLHLPWPALQVALEHVVSVGGRRRAFRFRAFPF